MGFDSFEHTPLLFGHDDRTGIVAVEPAGHFVRLYLRDESGIRLHDEPFHPFILVNDPVLLTGCQVPRTVRSLTGNGMYRYQISFDSWGECIAARDFLVHKTGKTPAAPEAPYQFIGDLAHQYLLATGTTLFKGIGFDKLRCLSLDIETDCGEGYGFPNPRRPDDRIISIALVDSNGDEVVLRGDLLDEAEMLRRLTDQITRRDPDVIIGHNIFRFDLEYIAVRARMHGVRLEWGRNGSEPHVTPESRWNIAEKSIDYPRRDIYGRHIIDTYFLVQLYDIGQRDLENHGLKAAARHFGLVPPDRTYITGEDITATFRDDPERLYRYNLDDARETMALYRLLAYPWFLQSRIFPYSFQNCPLRGNATRINALFVREYLHRGYALPERTAAPPPFGGGYTESAPMGVYGPIVHCDVASLYPSLMLTYRIGPGKDSLELFLPMLAELKRFRLDAKRAAREAQDDSSRIYYEALQQVFKILINSFFGYLGTALHNFSDPAAAAEVTRLGRVTIREMIGHLKEEGASIIEVDTDGIYFVPPPGLGEQEEAALVERLSSTFPNGIEVEMDGRYRTMLAYKPKNYAVKGYDGRVLIKGSSLRSRGMERYLREFMQEVIGALLDGNIAAVETLYGRYVARLMRRSLDVGWVARTESLNESPASYQEKVRTGKRNPSAAFEIACSSERVFRAGDQVSYYVCGSDKNAVAYGNCKPSAAFDHARPDINVPYYIEKLRHLKDRFEPLLPQQPSLFDL